MTDAKMIQEYLLWRRDKELYPPQWSPEEWVNETIMSESHARMNLIKDFLENNAPDPIEFANEVHKIVYDPLGELINDDVRLVHNESSQTLHQED